MLRDRFFQNLSSFRVLLISSNLVLGSQQRQMLKSIGFSTVILHNSHLAALSDPASVNATHVLFETRNADAMVTDFMSRILRRNPEAVLVPISDEPYVEYVFELLSAGARGLIVAPLTAKVLEEVLVLATMNPPASKLLREKSDRNKVLAAVVLNNLNHLSAARQKAKRRPEMHNVVRKWESTLSSAMAVALSYCENGQSSLRDEIVESCIARSREEATRLGLLRRELGKTRQRPEPHLSATSLASG